MSFSSTFVRRAALVCAPAVLCAVLLAGGCGPATQPDDHETDAGSLVHPTGLCQQTPRPNFGDVWRETFQGCATSGCHADGAGGLRFTNADEFLAATIRRPSSEVPGASRIVPGVPERSYLYKKLLEDAAARMPLNGPYLDKDHELMVAGWICGGAIDDRGQGDDGDGGGHFGDGDGDGGGAFFSYDGGPPEDYDGSHDYGMRDGGDRFPSDGSGEFFDFDGGGVFYNSDGGGPQQGDFDGGGVFYGSDGGPQQGPSDGGGVFSGPDGGSGGGGASTDPVLNGFSPRSGFIGSRVHVFGEHFGTDVRQMVVTFSGNAEAPIESAADGDLTVLVPDGAKTGPISITVGRITSTSVDSFEVVIPNPVPQLQALSPDSVSVGSGQLTLTLTGTGFVQGAQVMFDGVAISSTFVSATSFTAVVPATSFTHGAQHVVALQNPPPGGGWSTPLTFSVTNPVPAITSLDPAKVLAPSADATIALTGTGFTADSSVQVNGTPVTTTFVSPTHVDAQFTSNLLQVAALLTVTASNPGPGGGTSAAVSFSVENPPPTATRLSPLSLEVGATTRDIAVTGTSFTSLSRIKLDGTTLLTRFASSTRLEATLDASVVQVAGTHAVTVFTPAPGGGSTPPISLSVTNPAPALVSIDPTSGPTGSTNIFVRLTGSKFTQASVARVNGTAVPTTNVLDSSSIVANLPSVATGGDVQVTVYTPGPGGGTSVPVVFTYVDSGRPTITGLSPTRPGSGAPFTLTISGTNFGCVGDGAGAVLFNGNPLDPTQCSSTEVSVTVPSSAAGTYPVRVTNQSTGVTSDPANLTVFDPRPVPALTAVTPSLAGTSLQSLTVNLTGTGFAPDATVAANGSTIAATIADAAHATAVVPASLLGSPGSIALTVFNPGPGGGTSNPVSVQVVTPNPTPAISSVSPSRLDQGATSVVLHLTGSGFVPASSVTWDSAPRSTSYVDAAHLDVILPDSDAAQAGTHQLVVTNPAPGGGSSSALSISVVALNPQPSISQLSATSAAAGGSAFTLVVDGAGFISGSVVNLSGSPRTTSFISPTRVSATISSADLAVAGSFQITVVNPAPGGGTSNAVGFTVTNPVATIDGLSPTSVQVGGAAFTLAVSGTNFTQTSVVRLAGVDRTTHFVSATQLTADVLGADITTAGTLAVTVFNPAPGGGLSNASALAVTNPVPTVTSFSPCGAVAGGSGNLVITVTGTGFVTGMTATFGGTSVTATVTNANTATLTVPPSAYASGPTSRTVGIVVTSSGGSSAAKNFGLASRAVDYLTEIQQDIFNAKCTGCHGGSGGLFLSGDARSSLIGVASNEVPSLMRVQACEPAKDHSFIVDKLSSPVPAGGGSQMPQGGPYLSTTQVQTLQDWIAAGAK